MKIILSIFVFALFLNTANSHEYKKVIVEKTIKESSISQAIAIAAGQHHFKATTALQWSVGVGHDEKSAVSFGLGKQVGKVFISGNISSDGSTSAFGFSGSGTF